MLKKSLIGLAALVVVFLGFVATRPSTFTVKRSASMAAPRDIVFGNVNDFHRWGAWSPWEGLDPNQKRTFDGPQAGQGAAYSWSGNDQVGEGKMTIEESRPHESIRIKLEFIRPWQATNTVTIDFEPTDEGKNTTVHWAMEGHNDFMARLFSLFMDMDAMVGKDFETGLAGLGKVAEAEWKQLQADEAARKAAEAAAAAAQPAAEGQPAAPVAAPTE